MIRMQDWATARAQRRAHSMETFEGFVTDMMVARAEDLPRPQAFLVEQQPDWSTPSHYHLSHQFQVITAGAGRIGAHQVGPGAVHYASPESGYGPIVAGPEGIHYLTLRVMSDSGAWYLHRPGVRERMQRGLAKEQKHGSPTTPTASVPLVGLEATTIESLITPQANGLAAHLIRVPAAHTYALPADHRHGGRFYVMTNGSMHVGDKSLASLATVFASVDESFVIEAGASGLELLVLQFPADAVREDLGTIGPSTSPMRTTP